MDIIWQKVKSFNSHHFVFLILCSIIAYLFRASDTYTLNPVWRKKIDPPAYGKERDIYYTTPEYVFPSPIITDLEGDGVNEILLITSDFKLNILALPDAANKDPEDKTLPHVVVKEKIKLPIDIGQHGRSSQPVAMETGFTIIVIVTDDWHVFCYSSELKLLWQQHMMNITKVKDTYNVKAMGILITPHNIKKSDQGLVIVGGSFTHKTHEKDEKAVHNDTEHANTTTEEDNILTHFSSFALNAQDGTVRWHHLPGDFGEVVTNVKDIHGDHHWKLGLKRHRLHTGETPWSLYKDELYNYLPHFWGDLKDTKLTLGHFKKRSDSDSKTGTEQNVALTPEHFIGYAYGGHRPHSDHEHVQNPNAVVIHNHNGLEILNLLSGRPITELKLPSDRAIYVDIDNDGNVERLSWGEIEGYSPCYVEIWRFHPLQEKIEQLSVCRFTRVFFTSSWAFEEDNLKKLPPVVIKSVARKSGFFRYLLGHHLPTKTTQYDIITLGGMGKVSTGTGWALEAKDLKKKSETEKENYQEFMEAFQPSRKLMSLQVYGPKNVLVFASYIDVVLVDLQDGNILTSHSLPCNPTAPVVIGDFDNDGLNDLIITCKL
ncbi:hypothetical protein KUTeg_019307, partial [Tegillarca granosa]